MKEYRGYLELAPNNPTLFQQYFGEFTVQNDEGSSLTYDNPLAILGLPQHSCESSSMESANTGRDSISQSMTTQSAATTASETRTNVPQR